MIRFAAMLVCCLSCSISFGFPVPKCGDTPEVDPVDQIQIGMTQEEVERLLPKQDTKTNSFGHRGYWKTYCKSRITVSYLGGEVVAGGVITGRTVGSITSLSK
jgi:hypothetical protein